MKLNTLLTKHLKSSFIIINTPFHHVIPEEVAFCGNWISLKGSEMISGESSRSVAGVFFEEKLEKLKKEGWTGVFNNSEIRFWIIFLFFVLIYRQLSCACWCSIFIQRCILNFHHFRERESIHILYVHICSVASK